MIIIIVYSFRSEKKKREEFGRKRLESSSLVTTPVLDDNLVDYHKHRLVPEQEPFDLKYRLYAVVVSFTITARRLK